MTNILEEGGDPRSSLCHQLGQPGNDPHDLLSGWFPGSLRAPHGTGAPDSPRSFRAPAPTGTNPKHVSSWREGTTFRPRLLPLKKCKSKQLRGGLGPRREGRDGRAPWGGEAPGLFRQNLSFCLHGHTVRESPSSEAGRRPGKLWTHCTVAQSLHPPPPGPAPTQHAPESCPHEATSGATTHRRAL